MRRPAFLALVALLPTSAALADGCPPTTCGSTSVVQPGSRVLVLRPHGQSGPALGYDLVARKWRFSLPSGMLSADGTTFASARSRQGRAFTEVLRYDAETGRVRSRWPVGGRRMGVAGVSADGRSVALVETRRDGVVIAVVGRRGRSVVSLRGNYQVEALSPDGRRVYLVHWSRTGYALENVDLATRRLHPTKLAEPDERMEGFALAAVGTRDGRWLHTLYVKADGESFVHALDLAAGVGHCIDLPLRGDSLTVGATALTLSPDERRLYLASPLLGRVTTVNLERLRVARVARFRPFPLARFTLTPRSRPRRAPTGGWSRSRWARGSGSTTPPTGRCGGRSGLLTASPGSASARTDGTSAQSRAVVPPPSTRRPESGPAKPREGGRAAGLRPGSRARSPRARALPGRNLPR